MKRLWCLSICYRYWTEKLHTLISQMFPDLSHKTVFHFLMALITSFESLKTALRIERITALLHAAYAFFNMPSLVPCSVNTFCQHSFKDEPCTNLHTLLMPLNTITELWLFCNDRVESSVVLKEFHFVHLFCLVPSNVSKWWLILCKKMDILLRYKISDA